MIRYFIPLALAGYLCTGFYVVGPDEQAVVRRFGKVVATPKLPGLQFDLPWGLSEVTRVKPAQTKRVWIGRITAERLGSLRLSEFLTGDQNIIHVQATAQYALSDPLRYVLRARHVERVLQDAVEAELARTIAQSSVDLVRGEGGPQIQDRVLRGAQKSANDYALGVTIHAVNLDRVLPPAEVVDYFRQANDARNLHDQLIHQAEAEKRRLLALADSQAQEIRDQAIAYRDQVVQRARGSSYRFLALLKQYRRAKEITALRIYLETMERILPRLEGKLLVDSGEGVDLNLLREQRK